ncbi:MAG: sensor histidine kinase [Butyrivibrio sp.]|nr:sensor histidine kinase [Butyrivibrio sp.]
MLFYVLCLLAVLFSIYKTLEKKDETAVEVNDYSKEYSELWNKSKDKEDFFALWAHQIKTPISALRLLLEDKEDNKVLCKQELFKIESYVEMSLNYLRSDNMSSDLVLKEHSLDSMVKQVVKKYSSIFIYNHIELKLENIDFKILTDDKWFCFVLEQILSNALKYTKEGSVTIKCVTEETRKIVVVKDTGIGVKSEDIPRLFQKGFTGYNGRLDKKASGLGLYLCKKICDNLGHGIEISSEYGKGTEVSVIVYGENVSGRDLTKM